MPQEIQRKKKIMFQAERNATNILVGRQKNEKANYGYHSRKINCVSRLISSKTKDTRSPVRMAQDAVWPQQP